MNRAEGRHAARHRGGHHGGRGGLTIAEERNAEREFSYLMGRAQAKLEQMVEEFPDADYGARFFYCLRCSCVDAAIAPAAELVDDYPCPSCGCRQEIVSPVLDLQGERAP